MTTAKKDAPTKAAAHKDIEIVTEERIKRDKHGGQQTVTVPVGKKVPVVLIEHPIALKPEYEEAFRQDMRNICKRHDRGGKAYFEVGESDDMIEAAIERAIESLAGMGIKASRSVEFTPYMSRGEW